MASAILAKKSKSSHMVPVWNCPPNAKWWKSPQNYHYGHLTGVFYEYLMPFFILHGSFGPLTFNRYEFFCQDVMSRPPLLDFHGSMTGIFHLEFSECQLRDLVPLKMILALWLRSEPFYKFFLYMAQNEPLKWGTNIARPAHFIVLEDLEGVSVIFDFSEN